MEDDKESVLSDTNSDDAFQQEAYKPFVDQQESQQTAVTSTEREEALELALESSLVYVGPRRNCCECFTKQPLLLSPSAILTLHHTLG